MKTLLPSVCSQKSPLPFRAWKLRTVENHIQPKQCSNLHLQWNHFLQYLSQNRLIPKGPFQRHGQSQQNNRANEKYHFPLRGKQKCSANMEAHRCLHPGDIWNLILHIRLSKKLKTRRDKRIRKKMASVWSYRWIYKKNQRLLKMSNLISRSLKWPSNNADSSQQCSRTSIQISGLQTP